MKQVIRRLAAAVLSLAMLAVTWLALYAIVGYGWRGWRA